MLQSVLVNTSPVASILANQPSVGSGVPPSGRRCQPESGGGALELTCERRGDSETSAHAMQVTRSRRLVTRSPEAPHAVTCPSPKGT